MKNTFKVLGIIAIVAIIGLAMTACSEDSSPGTLTITGLGSFNDKYAIGMTEDDLPLVAADNVNFKTETINGVKIASGSVTLNVFKANGKGGVYDYNGSGKAVFYVIISSKASWDGSSQASIVGAGTVTVTFKDGVASGVFVPEI